jgi:phosphate transport system permease protein
LSNPADHSSLSGRRAGAVDSDRPLLLTPGQDLAGFVGNLAGRGFLFAITFASVLAVLLIFIFIGAEAIPFFAEVNVTEFFRTTEWYPTHEPAEWGGLALLLGSLYVTLIAVVIAVPIGLLAAVFLSDIVSFKLRQIIKPVIEILAAIPSVAVGFFAFLVVAPWLQNTLGMDTGANALNAGVLLAVMAMPTIVSIAEDSLTAIGRELREGAYALGSTRAEMLLKVVIPAAGSGIIAAIILGVMRAVGETMLVLMAAGNASQIPHPWWDLTQSVRTMTGTIAFEMGEAPHGGTHYHCLFAVGLILLVITFALNLTSEYFLNRSRRKLRGGGK